MLPTKLSFVDIETTGTSIFSDRIIEICILRVENNHLVREFSTLVNPETRIDPFIEKYTGISSEELEDAPLFYKIKDEILEHLSESIFVAHNVRFDYGFVRNEFSRVGLKFSSKHLCTVKLARLLYPGFKRYNLDSLIERHQLEIKSRHRAYDDTKAIWDFYKKSYDSIDSKKFIKAINIVLRFFNTKANYKNIRTLKKRDPQKEFQISDESLNLYV